MAEYLFRSDLLNTTNEALKLHSVKWADWLGGAVKELSGEEAEKHGVSRYSNLLVQMNADEAERLAHELHKIEIKVGSDTIFSNLPIHAATETWLEFSSTIRKVESSN